MEKSYERLGVFYLGRKYDMERAALLDDLLLYDSKDLTTHAVCVGMTGSGKTGLCIALLEEAAIDGIPTIAIDPKGDLGNLLLTFPDLRPEDFRPWIDESEAARKGTDPDSYARAIAKTWNDGLAKWDQDGERIARFRAGVELEIYTPGSAAGRPLALLRSFEPPADSILEDGEALREQIQSIASSLLVLIGRDPDPVKSREHILIATILEKAWVERRALDLAALIREIREPSFGKVGVLDLESFFPAKERFDLAMGLNNLLASPSFASWMEGDPLDVQSLLYTKEGKPKISILSIAHLGEAERMFFVTLLLNEVVAWIRTLAGSSSLRALLYMDEVFGFFPPVSNPPSKQPMLVLLKQARAYGLGVVLATQNPVDLDYKGLSNAGTWLLGRLQTARDKERVLDGLEGAAQGGVDRKRLDALLSGLGSRVFLMHNVHESEPVVFHSRWAMSYLRGPLTREQIRMLSGSPSRGEPQGADAAREAPAPEAKPAAVPAKQRPLIPPGIEERFAPASAAEIAARDLVYRPYRLARARQHFVSAKHGIDLWEDVQVIAPLLSGETEDPWAEAEIRAGTAVEFSSAPEPGAGFDDLPSEAVRPKEFAASKKELIDHLYRTRTLTIWRCPMLEETSREGETEAEFRIRVTQSAREKRDEAVEEIREKYAAKIQRLEDRIRTAEERLEREKSQYEHQKVQTAISMGATLLGALLGRRKVSATSVGRMTTAARGVGRTARQKQDIAPAQERIETLLEERRGIEAEAEAELAQARDRLDPTAIEIEPVEIRSRKGDLSVGDPMLLWITWRKRDDGLMEPAASVGADPTASDQ